MTPTRRKPTIRGSFAGSVLLSKAEWDKEQLIRDLREEWGIVDEEPDEGDEDVENSDDAVVMRVGNMMLIVTLFHGHIPDNEAEINAENNYMWPEAVEVAKAHKAHIVVAVLSEEEKLLERGKLFTKAMAVCCKQKYATGVYTSGVVFEPRFYEGPCRYAQRGRTAHLQLGLVRPVPERGGA